MATLRANMLYYKNYKYNNPGEKMSSQQLERLLAAALIIGVLLFGGALLVAAINVAGQIASFWFLLVVQIAIGALLLGVVLSLIGRLAAGTMRVFADLYARHDALAKAMKKRTPWFVVLTALVAQAVVAIADKSFQGQTFPTIAITLVLIILFFLANELITRDRLALRVAGFALWFIAVLTLPFFVLADRDFNWAVLHQEAMGIPWFYRTMYSLIALVFVFTPLLFVRKED